MNKKVTGETNSLDNREYLSTNVYWEKGDGKISVTSYVANTKSAGKRNILVLSTMSPIVVIKYNDKKKPSIIKLYDFIKVTPTLLAKGCLRIAQSPSHQSWLFVLSHICCLLLV